MYKHILISTDGSDLAGKGVDHGLFLAREIGARVTFVTVTLRDPMTGSDWTPGPTEMTEYDTTQKASALQILADAKATADKLGIGAGTIHVPDAFPAEAIVETAKQHNCDLIVIASHGRRGIRRLLLGSQTSEVLLTSPVPVLVVK